MKVTFLGTGTSGGIPVINCDCPVCASSNPRNKRLRCSVMIEVEGLHLLIDTCTDMRQQFLTHYFPKIDAVLFTHSHADHIFGLDELRRFNYLQKDQIPVYGNQTTIGHLKQIFNYAFNDGDLHFGRPNLSENIVNGRLEIDGVEIYPIPLLHGSLEILGYRIGNFAYCTDVSRIPGDSYKLLQDLDVLVLDALREKKHPTHFSLDEAVLEAQKIKAKKTYFTHISHILDYDKHGSLLPDNCCFAYDGLVLDL